ncbi:MAG: hypothetical protein HY876_05580 [Coriobacteriales bacterium]|nr:hypothetical protein [Coriobacteriales bacterium]
MALIPVVSVGYGGGGGSGSGGPEEGEGSGEGQGFGFGVSARPVGTLEVSPQSVVYQPVVDWTQLAKIWSWIAGVALLAFVLRMLFSSK